MGNTVSANLLYNPTFKSVLRISPPACSMEPSFLCMLLFALIMRMVTGDSGRGVADTEGVCLEVYPESPSCPSAPPFPFSSWHHKTLSTAIWLHTQSFLWMDVTHQTHKLTSSVTEILSMSPDFCLPDLLLRGFHMSENAVYFASSRIDLRGFVCFR